MPWAPAEPRVSKTLPERQGLVGALLYHNLLCNHRDEQRRKDCTEA